MDVSGGYDWAMARDACAPRDLCSTAQLCDGQQLKYQGNISWNDNIWLPVSDDENVWISTALGRLSNRISARHGRRSKEQQLHHLGGIIVRAEFSSTQRYVAWGSRLILLVPNFLFQSISEICIYLRFDFAFKYIYPKYIKIWQYFCLIVNSHHLITDLKLWFEIPLYRFRLQSIFDYNSMVLFLFTSGH